MLGSGDRFVNQKNEPEEFCARLEIDELGRLVQLVRTLRLHRRGHPFESDTAHSASHPEVILMDQAFVLDMRTIASVYDDLVYQRLQRAGSGFFWGGLQSGIQPI
jgi:hypothetical protein